MLYDDAYSGSQNIRETIKNAFKNANICSEEISDKLIDVFVSVKQHVSANDFTVLLKEHDVFMEEAKVAEALEIMADLGYAMQQIFEGEEIKRFEPLKPHEHHDHFVCIKCNRIIEFSDDELEALQESLVLRKGCKPLFHKLQVYGICDRCAQTEKKAEPIIYAKEDTEVELSSIKGSGSMKKRLTELGFVNKGKIKVIKNCDFGPIVLEVKGTRFAIGRKEATSILVHLSEPHAPLKRRRCGKRNGRGRGVEG